MVFKTGRSLSSLLNRAQEVRRKNFPAEIGFDRPRATRAISVTGEYCALNCAHCGGHFLQGMLPPAGLEAELTAPTERKPVYRSLLVSGGCDRLGRVPVAEHPSLLAALKQKFRLNIHPGLAEEEEARIIGRYADAVSFDFIVHDDTIREVLGLNRSGADYIRAYRALRRYTRVYPHLVIGLRGGRLAGEYAALESLRALGVDGLVLIVFFPVSGTRYADRKPPPLEEVAALMATARIMFPQTPIYLGCMRPGGRYRAELDMLAVQAGLNKIVLPVRPAVKLAGDTGWRIVWGDECCVL